MQKDSRSIATQNVGVNGQPKYKEWALRALFALPGLIALSGAIGLLQNLARASTNNIENLILVDNWIPWLAVLFFALGWFTTHWIEVALLKKRITLAKILFLVVLFEGAIFSAYFRYFIDHDILQRFSNSVMQLTMSAVFLRYSTFSIEAIAIQRKILFGEKIEASR